MKEKEEEQDESLRKFTPNLGYQTYAFLLHLLSFSPVFVDFAQSLFYLYKFFLCFCRLCTIQPQKATTFVLTHRNPCPLINLLIQIKIKYTKVILDRINFFSLPFPLYDVCVFSSRKVHCILQLLSSIHTP